VIKVMNPRNPLVLRISGIFGEALTSEGVYSVEIVLVFWLKAPSSGS
jgi:hypothetical protein